MPATLPREAVKVVPDKSQNGKTGMGGKVIHLVVHSYALKHGDRYYANCIDLNLSVERPTMEEAVRELDCMVEGYLKHAIELGCPKHLLHRPARLSKRLEYWKTWLLCGVPRFLRRNDDRDIRVESKRLPCAV